MSKDVNTKGDKPRIFLSHSSQDKPFVRRLVKDLEAEELNVWLDEQELGVGDSIVRKIADALKKADYLIIVLSPESVRSKWVKAELNSALMEDFSNKGIAVLPVLIEDCEIPFLLRDRVYADFRTDYDLGLNSLLKVFQQESEQVLSEVEGFGDGEISPSFNPKKLRDLSVANLRRLISKHLDRAEVATLWYDSLGSKMDDDMANRTKNECVIELIERVKSRDLFSHFTDLVYTARPDLFGLADRSLDSRHTLKIVLDKAVKATGVFSPILAGVLYVLLVVRIGQPLEYLELKQVFLIAFLIIVCPFTIAFLKTSLPHVFRRSLKPVKSAVLIMIYIVLMSSIVFGINSLLPIASQIQFYAALARTNQLVDDGQYDQAHSKYLSLSTQKMDKPIVFSLADRLGTHYTLHQNFPKALEVYKKAIEFTNVNAKHARLFYNNYAYVLLKNDEPIQAKEMLNTVETPDPLTEFLLNCAEKGGFDAYIDELRRYEAIMATIEQRRKTDNDNATIRMVCFRMFNQTSHQAHLGLVEMIKETMATHLESHFGIKTIDYENLTLWQRSANTLEIDTLIESLIRRLNLWRHKQPFLVNITGNADSLHVTVSLDSVEYTSEVHHDLGTENDPIGLINLIANEITELHQKRNLINATSQE